MADSTAALTESMRRYVDMQNKQLNLQRQQNEMMERSSRSTFASRLQLGQFTNYMMALSKSAGFAGVAVRGLSRATMVMTSILAEPIRIVQDLSNTLTHFIGLANPGAVQLFTLALNDAMAVIGRMLTPVLRGMTIYIRAFGDALAKLEPILSPLFQELGQQFANTALGAFKILEAMTPIINLIAVGLAELLRKAGAGMAFLQGVVIELITTITKLMGISGLKGNPNADSTGASVRQVRTQGVEEFARSVFEKSLMGIFNQGKKDPVAIQQDILAAIREGQAVVAKIRDHVEMVANYISTGWDVLSAWLGENTVIAILNGLAKSTGMKDAGGGFIDAITAMRKAFVR